VAIVSVGDLGKRYGKRWLFQGLEFDLEPGNCLIAAGANGSGKSTLVRVVAGLIPATQGWIKRPERSRFGYAALDQALYGALTAAEHLDMAASLNGYSARFDLGRVGLGDAADQLVGQFSTGMRTRLKFALALQGEPDFVILDEPSAALDDSGRAILAELVTDHLKRGALLLATNDPADRRFGTHEIVLDS
jgi:ABC-type multidrug transport system ATPase subunit